MLAKKYLGVDIEYQNTIQRINPRKKTATKRPKPSIKIGDFIRDKSRPMLWGMVIGKFSFVDEVKKNQWWKIRMVNGQENIIHIDDAILLSSRPFSKRPTRYFNRKYYDNL